MVASREATFQDQEHIAPSPMTGGGSEYLQTLFQDANSVPLSIVLTASVVPYTCPAAFLDCRGDVMDLTIPITEKNITCCPVSGLLDKVALHAFTSRPKDRPTGKAAS